MACSRPRAAALAQPPSHVLGRHATYCTRPTVAGLLLSGADDVELLLERMTRQFTALRKTFDDELEEVETAFMQERAELMHSNQQELSALMQKRLDKEEQYMEARRRRVDEDQRQLEAQRVQDAEDFNILKIKLETEIQTLEQQLEEMRATYQLNQEKLDYK